MKPPAILPAVRRAYLSERCWISNKEPWTLRGSSGLLGGLGGLGVDGHCLLETLELGETLGGGR